MTSVASGAHDMLQRRDAAGIEQAAPRFGWAGHPDETVARAWRDATLAFVTLGISRFWTTTAHRRRMWSSVHIDGERLAYTGTALDLALPAMFAVMGAGLVIVFGYDRIVEVFDLKGGWRMPTFTQLGGSRLFYMVPLLILIGMARYRARNFLLHRVVLGTRSGRMTGRPMWFGPRHLISTLAIGPTLGWVMPARAVWLTSRLVRETELGGHPMTFEPRYGALYGAFARAWLAIIGIYLAINVALSIAVGPKIAAAVALRSLPAFTPGELATLTAIALMSILAIAVIAALYSRREQELMWSMTGWRGLRFRCVMTRRAHLGLVFSNAALLIMSLGALKQVAVTRTLRAHTLALRLEPATVIELNAHSPAAGDLPASR